MKHLFTLFLAGISYLAHAQEHFALDQTDDLIFQQTTAEVVEFKGKQGLLVHVNPDHKSIEQGGCDNCSFVNIPTENFSDGIIEVEVAGKPKDGAPEWNRGFVGIVFRVNETMDQFEGVYLRPMNAIADNQKQRNHTVQYFSYPDHPWHQLRENQPGHYETFADIRPGEWIKLKINIDGDTMQLYIDDRENPALIVNDLKGGKDLSGTIGLFTEPETDAYFRNLTITPKQ